MKIKFTEPVAGARFAYRKNQVRDLPTPVAKEFIRLRQAIKAPADTAPIEEAVTGAPEAAVARPSRMTRLFS